MDGSLNAFGATLPIVAAPMAGGPTTPDLVRAAAAAGGFGFLAGGNLGVDALAEKIAAVRGLPFGVNLFAPNPVPAEPGAFRDYSAALQPDADDYGIELDPVPVEDDDHFREKIELLLRDPVPVVSFTFGLPGSSVVAALRRAGSIVVQTVTSPAEAAAADADALVVQASVAGGHSATLTPDRPLEPTPLPELVAHVRAAVDLPVLAAGGLATSADIAAVLRAGAGAAVVGTVLLRTDESGASATHRAALADPDRRDTVLTRAFTGRPARSLRNRFVQRFDAIAPAGFPALHHLTAPLRRAATAAGDADRTNLWAGTGYRHAVEGPAVRVFEQLAAGL